MSSRSEHKRIPFAFIFIVKIYKFDFVYWNDTCVRSITKRTEVLKVRLGNCRLRQITNTENPRAESEVCCDRSAGVFIFCEWKIFLSVEGKRGFKKCYLLFVNWFFNKIFLVCIIIPNCRLYFVINISIVKYRKQY